MIIISNHVFIQFEKYPSTPPNKNKQKSPGGQLCSSPEFHRKVNDILVIIKVAINQTTVPAQGPVPSFFTIQMYLL